MTRALAALALGFTLLATSPARAGDSAGAQVLFNDARRLMREGDYEHACPKLEESQRLDPGMGTVYNLADCYEHVGRIASAWGRFVEVAGEAKANGQTAREQDARARAAALEPRLSRLTIVVPPAQAEIAGLEVLRDDTVVGRAQWGMSLPIDPGAHAITARAPDRIPWTGAVEIAGDGKTATIEVPDLAEKVAVPSAEPAPVPAARPAEAPARDGSGQRVLAIGLLGLGVVGVGVGSAFGIVSMSAGDDAEQHCSPANGCDRRGVELRDDAFTAGTVSTIAFAAGLAAVAGGVIVWLTAPRAETRARVAKRGLVLAW